MATSALHSINHLIRDLSNLTANLVWAYTDLESARTNATPIYNLDFSVGCPVLFPRSATGTKPFREGVAPIMRSLFNRHNDTEPYVFAVGPCFYLEFCDYIEHERAHAENLARRSSPSDILNLLTLKSSNFIHEVEILIGHESKRRITEPVRQLSTLIQSKRLHGLGDYIVTKQIERREKSIVPQVAQLFAEQKRQRAPTDTRQKDDAEFHYYMDAWNIALTFNSEYIENRHGRLILLTESRYVYDAYKADQKELVRSPFVPLYIKNSTDLTATGGAAGARDYLINAMYRAKMLIDSLKACTRKGMEHLPVTLRDDLIQFYENYVHRLERLEPEVREDAPPASEELKWILSDPKRVREGAERVLADAEAAAKEISSYAAACGLYLLDEFDMENNPVYQTLTRRFGVR